MQFLVAQLPVMDLGASSWRTNASQNNIPKMRRGVALACALAHANSACTFIGMGIGAGADSAHNSIEPAEAREETGNRVVVELRDEYCRTARPAPGGEPTLKLECQGELIGPLGAMTETRFEGSPGQVGETKWVEIQVGEGRVAGDNVSSVERAEGRSSGFWIGMGVGAAVDAALAITVALACKGGCGPQ